MSKLKNFKEKLLKTGYKNYRDKIYKDLFQKKFVDEKGTKYFIDFIQNFNYNYDYEGFLFRMTCQLHVIIDNKKVTIDVNGNQWFNTEEKEYQHKFFPKLEEIEKFVDNLWKHLGSHYYELNK